MHKRAAHAHTPLNGSRTQVEQLIKKHFMKIRGVEGVYTIDEGPVTHVWTKVTSTSRRLEDAVYEREAKIIRAVGNRGLDFHLTMEAVDGKLVFSKV